MYKNEDNVKIKKVKHVFTQILEIGDKSYKYYSVVLDKRWNFSAR